MLTKTDEQVLAEKLTITVEHAGAMLGVGRTGAYAAVRSGIIPSIRIGKTFRVPTAGMRKLLKMPAEAVQKEIQESEEIQAAVPPVDMTRLALDLASVDAELRALSKYVRRLIKAIK